MPVRTKLPPSATFAQRLLYGPVRGALYFLFTFLPYHPVKRFRKPDLTKGPYLWACSHSNYLCDAVPAGFEGPIPTKFLAKSTLFVFPIKAIIEFCGALPVARAEDFKGVPAANRSMQNRSTFKVAIAKLQEGWPVAVFPEGMSIVSPGLVLPFKPGIAKLGFAAEEASDFSLGLKIIPVGLEYGSRRRVGSGLNIRYGNPIQLSDYKDLYRESKDQAVQRVMETLTREMILNFPHFKDEKTAALGRKIKALGLVRYRYDIAQIFLKKENDPAFWTGLDIKMRAFDEANKQRGIPTAAWGHRRAWKELGPTRRRIRLIFLILGAPLAVVDLINNTIPELCLATAVDYVAVDETEAMTIRFMASPVVLGIMYALQFWFLKKVVFPETLEGAGFSLYLAYALSSFALWYFGVHWRKQVKRLASLFYFWKAGVDGRSAAVAYYRALRQHVGEFQNHRR